MSGGVNSSPVRCGSEPIVSGVTGGGKGDICPRAQHSGGTKLMSECYELIKKCKMSADASNYSLQNVECHCEI